MWLYQSRKREIGQAYEHNKEMLADRLNNEQLSVQDLYDIVDKSNEAGARLAIAEQFDKIQAQDNYDDRMGIEIAHNFAQVPRHNRSMAMEKVINANPEPEQPKRLRDEFMTIKEKKPLRQRIRERYQKWEKGASDYINRYGGRLSQAFLRGYNRAVNLSKVIGAAGTVAGRHAKKHYDNTRERLMVASEKTRQSYQNFKQEVRDQNLINSNDKAIKLALSKHPETLTETLNAHPEMMDNKYVFRAVQANADKIAKLKLSDTAIRHFNELNKLDTDPNYQLANKNAQKAFGKLMQTETPKTELANKQAPETKLADTQAPEAKQVEKKPSLQERCENFVQTAVLGNPAKLVNWLSKKPEAIKMPEMQKSLARHADEVFGTAETNGVGLDPSTLEQMIAINKSEDGQETKNQHIIQDHLHTAYTKYLSAGQMTHDGQMVAAQVDPKDELHLDDLKTQPANAKMSDDDFASLEADMPSAEAFDNGLASLSNSDMQLA